MHTTTTQSNRVADSSVFHLPQNITRQLMSSREIAELTGKGHNHVLRDIRKILEALKDDPSLDHVREEKDSRGYTSEISLDRDLTDTLLTGYSAKMRIAVIRRWRELEAQASLRIPANYAEALQVAADQAKESQRLQLLVDHQAPKVAAINRLAAAGGSICISDAAKQLQLSPSQLFTWLEAHRWIFHRGGSKRWTAYQPQITKGFMVHKVTELKPDAETGADRAAYQPLITPKGLTYLAEKNIGAAL